MVRAAIMVITIFIIAGASCQADSSNCYTFRLHGFLSVKAVLKGWGHSSAAGPGHNIVYVCDACLQSHSLCTQQHDAWKVCDPGKTPSQYMAVFDIRPLLCLLCNARSDEGESKCAYRCFSTDPWFPEIALI